MKTALKFVLTALLLSVINAPLSNLRAQGTAFTYQGRLNDGASTANGSYDFQFAIYDAVTGGMQQGVSVTNAATAVTNGFFTVTLDFGNQFPAADRWLEIAARTNGAANFTTLIPRQQLTPTPYAITAGSVSSTGLSGTYSGAVSMNNANNSFGGSFKGNGENLSGVNATSLNGLTGEAFWKAAGNTGADPVNGAYIGTADNLPLEFKVNGARVLRLEPTSDSPNLIGGYPGNVVSNGFRGAFIGGGGFPTYINSAGANFASVVGGLGNSASGYVSTAMGAVNTASGGWSTAMGAASTASGDYSMVMGYSNIASGMCSLAVGEYSTAGGSSSVALGENCVASAFAATALGYHTTAAGSGATALGASSQALHNNTFVWSDGSSAMPFASSAAKQFLINASGGVGIGTSTPASALHVKSVNPDCEISISGGDTYDPDGSSSSPPVPGRRWSLQSSSPVADGQVRSSFQIIDRTEGVSRVLIDTKGNVGIGSTSPSARLYVEGDILASGTITGLSDRNMKEHFVPVDSRDVLEKICALPITEWNYKTDNKSARHIGPMAQDFHAAFNVGMDDKHISMVDADGVALAAIQALNEKVEEKEAKLQQQAEEIASLKTRLEKLEKLMANKIGSPD